MKVTKNVIKKGRTTRKKDLRSKYDFVMGGSAISRANQVYGSGDSFQKFSLYKDYQTTATPNTSL